MSNNFETMSAEEFRRSGLIVRGRRVSQKPVYAHPKTYSKKSDPPKRTRAGGIVNVIVDETDALG